MTENQYTTDPEELKQIFGKNQKTKEEDQYLSYSEASDEYEYLVYKIKKGNEK